MQNVRNPSDQRLPFPGSPLPDNRQVSTPAPRPQPAPAGGIPVEHFRQPSPSSASVAHVQSLPQQPAPLQTVPQPATTPPQQQRPAQPQPPLTPTEQKQQARKELKQAIGHSNEILATARTVFPFTFFPDTVTIDRGKLTISHHFFFKTSEVTSLRIEDILNATVNMGPVFGSLKVATRFFGTDKVYTINYLRREDAIKIKCVLQGYIIALQKEIDCSSLSTEELSRLLSELGSDAPDEK